MNQRTIILIAIFFTLFILWNQWEAKQYVDTNGNTTVKTTFANTSSITTNTGADVPSVISTNTDLETPGVSAVKDNNILVSTDVLTLEISPVGGTVQNAKLNDYPEYLHSDEAFVLLNSTPGFVFVAESGLASANNALPNHLSEFQSEQKQYQMNGDNLTVSLLWEGDNGISVKKNFRFKKGSYAITVDYDINNASSQLIPAKSYTRLTRTGGSDSNMMMPTFTGGVVYDPATDSVQKNDFDDWGDFQTLKAQGGWMAITQQYFIAGWIPNQNETQIYSSSTKNGLYKLTNENPQISIPAGTQANLSANELYLGPKEYDNIEKIAAGMNYTLDYGWLDILASPLSWAMHKINDVVDSWGWSIILITVLIKIIFYPLSEKSYRSMAGMRKLAPRMEHIKKTYGDDRQKLGQKTMELYKKEKVNPASGCLPILVQIPVFIAFYWMLLDTVELRQTEFWWISDLADMDPYFILPIIMGASMFVQQKLNPPPPDPMQAKIMMSLPFVFTVMFLWFPAGLVLYWVVNNILSIAQQWAMNKRVNG